MDSQFHPRFSFKAFTGYWDGHKDAQSSNTPQLLSLSAPQGLPQLQGSHGQGQALPRETVMQ